MENKINLHTHSTFCDGHNTPQQMIESAIQKGFTVLGFSGHSMYPFSSDWHIPSLEHDNYVSTIRSLADKYKDKIQIFCGFEVDYIPPFSIPEKKHFGDLKPDYLIGAVHYVVNDNKQMTVDDSTENVRKLLKEVYNNDGKKMVQDYFAAQREMLKKADFEIWAHPDLIRKRNGILNFFDETEEWYKNEIKETIRIAAKTQVVAEINTGAIARGAMNDVYPSEYFLNLLNEAGIPVCINSDCHNAPDLDCAFDFAIRQAKKAGYSQLTYPTGSKIITVNI